MTTARLTEEQIIGLVHKHEAGAKCADLSRKHGPPERQACEIAGADRKRVRYQSQSTPPRPRYAYQT